LKDRLELLKLKLKELMPAPVVPVVERRQSESILFEHQSE
jgi:hypothetical protein